MISPWGDSIPEDWEETPLKHLTKTVTGGTPNRSDTSFWDGSIPWVSSKDMKEWELADTEGHVTQKAIEEGETTLVPKGSLLMVSRSGILEHTIPVAVANRELAINQDIRAYIPEEDIRSRYLRDIFIGFEDDLLQLWKQQGATVQSLNSVAVSETRIPVPSLEKQSSIIAYSEAQVERINKLIQKYQRLEDLLESQEQALTDNLLTNGAKESKQVEADILGVESLPRDWEEIRLKFLLNSIEQGWSPKCNETPSTQEEWGVLKAGAVNGGVFDSSENKTLPSGIQPREEYCISKGDVLMNRASGSEDLLGSAAIVDEECHKLLLCDKIYRLHPRANRITPEFLSLALQSHTSKVQIRGMISGAKGLANNIPQSDLKNLDVPVPPIHVQRKIVERVGTEREKVRSCSCLAREMTRKLREKRQALITAAVTGQIDVSKVENEAKASHT